VIKQVHMLLKDGYEKIRSVHGTMATIVLVKLTYTAVSTGLCKQSLYPCRRRTGLHEVAVCRLLSVAEDLVADAVVQRDIVLKQGLARPRRPVIVAVGEINKLLVHWYLETH